MKKWHIINFKIKWDRILPCKDFFIDLIIIDLLFSPVIKKFKPNLVLWRLHRSATNEGHIVRFIFYTTTETAKEVFEFITSNSFYTFIKDNYLETEIDLKEGSNKIEATSDGKWPIEIQKSWPYYIMGASEMFINLIEDIKKKKTDKINKDNRVQLENYYKEIEEEIIDQWVRYGQHSFFHHLEAIFGYNPTWLLFRAGINIFPREK